MIGKQLDLFGGAPMPPKNIRVEEEETIPEESEIISEKLHDNQQAEEVLEDKVGLIPQKPEQQESDVFVQMPGLPNDSIIITTNAEELPDRVGEEEETSLNENPEAESAAPEPVDTLDNIDEEGTIGLPEEDAEGSSVEDHVNLHQDAESDYELYEPVEEEFKEDSFEAVGEVVEGELQDKPEEIGFEDGYDNLQQAEDDIEIEEEPEPEKQEEVVAEKMEHGSEVLEEVEDDLEIESAVESEDQEENAEEGNNAERETVQVAESFVEVEQDTVTEVPHVQEEALLQEEPIVSEQVIEKDADMAADESHPEVETSEKGLNIPEDNALYSRQYYTMRETAAMFNVNQSLLRFWENEFDILKPKKNRKGDRYFRPEDIKNLELIYHLLRVRKFTIEGAKDYLKSKAKSMQTFEMVQRLEKLKHFLLDIKTAI